MPLSGEIKGTRSLIAMDLALSALARKRYSEAVRWLVLFESVTPLWGTLESLQELAGIVRKTNLDERTDSIYSGQLGRVKSRLKSTTEALKTVSDKLATTPGWKPPERLQLTVTVKDKAGAVVVGAAVFAEDISNRVRVIGLTGADGKAILPGLMPAVEYTVDVSGKGFQREGYSDDNPERAYLWFGDAEKTLRACRKITFNI
jgi:hypothetical protein